MNLLGLGNTDFGALVVTNHGQAEMENPEAIG